MSKGIIKSCEHIDFVPNKYVKNSNLTDDFIYVFSRKFGKRINKRKNKVIGVVIFCPNEHSYDFGTIGNITLSKETLQIIAYFIEGLNSKIIRFDRKKGEFVE